MSESAAVEMQRLVDIALVVEAAQHTVMQREREREREREHIHIKRERERERQQHWPCIYTHTHTHTHLGIYEYLSPYVQVHSRMRTLNPSAIGVLHTGATGQLLGNDGVTCVRFAAFSACR